MAQFPHRYLLLPESEVADRMSLLSLLLLLVTIVKFDTFSLCPLV